MALSSTMVWEIRQNASDTTTGGGGFNASGSSPGTDWSLQSSAQVTIDGVTISAAVQSTTTKIKLTGYTVQNSDNRNTVQITGGTATAGVYEITAVDTSANNTWTLDRSAGTNGQTATGAMGGAAASLGFVCSKAVSGNNIWIKYSASVYSISSATNNVAGGRATLPANCICQGYDSSRGDFTSNRPTLQASVNNIQPIVTISSAFGALVNVIVDAGSATGIDCVNVSVRGSYAYKVKVIGGANAYGMQLQGGNAIACAATSCSIAPFKFGTNGGACIGCVSASNTTNGWTLSNVGTCHYCISANNTGDGFLADSLADAFVGCIAYGNSGHGFNSNSAATIGLPMVNCIAVNQTTAAKVGFNTGQLFNCSAYNNTTNFTSANTTQTNCHTLTGDPFTNAAGNDFSLNNTAGAGAVCRAGGFPGIYDSLISTTGYQDIGVQHQDTPGGGGSAVVVGSGQQYLE